MRKLTATVKTLLANDLVSIYYLVKIVGDGVTFLDTTATTTITIPTIGTFLPNDGLITVEPPRLSSVVDREIYKLAYIDPNFEKRSVFEAGLTGALVSVYVGFFNTTEGALSGAAPGEPIQTKEDLIIAYQGFVDTQGYSVEPNEGVVIATLECASPMAALGLVKPFYTSKESIRAINPNDTAFDQIYAGSGKIAYLWGKA